MRDDLGQQLRARAERIPVPTGEMNEVLTGGRRKVRLRMATVVGVTTLVALVVVLIRANPFEGDGSPAPVGPSIHERLVPDVTVGPTPPVSMGTDTELDNARAATVAFHALVSSTGYKLDYTGLERNGLIWTLSFREGLSAQELRGVIKSRQVLVQELKLKITTGRARTEVLTGQLAEARRAGLSTPVQNCAVIAG
jgi:hypothetical protein